VLGVTGTNGKTTTTYMLDAILRTTHGVTGLIGTIETRVGHEAIPSVRTTPESTDLHALLAVMRERGATMVVMEVSSHALVMGRVDGVVFDVVGFTNLSQDHLDFHGDMESYFAAKATLFTPERARRGVICVDDVWGQRLARESTIPVAQVANGATATLIDRNAALASAMAGAVGDDPVVADALARTVQVPGRMERVQLPGVPARVYVDYAHTPEAIEAVVAGAPGAAPGSVVVVLGAGGDRDPSKRALMGAAAARTASAVIVTDDNPRSEDPAAIRAAVLSGAREASASSGSRVEEVGDRRVAISRGLALANELDATLLVLGKGHEQGQEIAGVVHPFDDRAVLRELLAEGSFPP
jgi:UDP-N-acetylmuramoyl-L-alanyl-D-glutamate--2,6-diaminopimelate ligase